MHTTSAMNKDHSKTLFTSKKFHEPYDLVSFFKVFKNTFVPKLKTECTNI